MLVDVTCPISLLQKLAVAGVAREVARRSEKSMVHVRQTRGQPSELVNSSLTIARGLAASSRRVNCLIHSG